VTRTWISSQTFSNASSSLRNQKASQCDFEHTVVLYHEDATESVIPPPPRCASTRCQPDYPFTIDANIQNVAVDFGDANLQTEPVRDQGALEVYRTCQPHQGKSRMRDHKLDGNERAGMYDVKNFAFVT